MDADFDARLRADGVTLTERDARLLETVDETASIHAAADELGRSYSRSHARITDLEAAFGPLVERQRGGSGGGGSRLTENARKTLARFDRLRAGYASIADTAEAVLDGTVEARDGELGTVETAAGRVRALVPPDADAVQVCLRADAVTLHDPADAPDADATSARNRFEGTIASIDRGEAVSLVAVAVGTGTPVFALVTEESRERLDLRAGRSVVASFKATATRATRR
ncbi:TOBE domain-containing protein [Salarchaeum japonicum]|uniref:Mop domain-containing protein n=1 Tax=Salarchaeum japonicum TaxID=555573 RepID=A0AAV3T4R2_9EURY|nr:TOBE domain-containing protein [Salarchaeum japonicum]